MTAEATPAGEAKDMFAAPWATAPPRKSREEAAPDALEDAGHLVPLVHQLPDVGESSASGPNNQSMVIDLSTMV